MSKLTVRFINNLPLNSRVFIGGEEASVKRDKSGVSECQAEVSGKAEVAVKNPFEAQLPFAKWFLRTLFYWIISAFGLFDFVPNKDARVINFAFSADINEDSVATVKFNRYMIDKQAAEITESSCETQISENLYTVDKKAKKRNRAYGAIRVLSVLAMIAVAAVVIIKSITG